MNTQESRDKGLLIIGKLLRKAEQTTAGEAEALWQKAQELATRHSIDLALARLADERAHQREVVEERSVVIGRKGQHHITLLRHLFVVIAQVNDVTVLVRGADPQVYPIGMPEDLDATQALFTSLAAQMSAAADQWLSSENYAREVARAGRAKPAKTTSRGHFYEGFISRVGARLQAAHDQAVDEALAAAGQPAAADSAAGAPGRGPSTAGGELSSTALALRAKHEAVNDFLAAHHPRLGVRRLTRRSRPTVTAQSSRRRGRQAADRASLSAQRRLGRG